MRIALMTTYIPYPLSEGGSVAQFAVLDYLLRENEVHLIVPIRFSWDLDRVNALKMRLPQLKVVTIDEMSHTSHRGVKNKIGIFLGKISRKLAKDNVKERQDLIVRYSYFRPYDAAFAELIISILDKITPDIIQVDLLGYLGLGMLIPSKYKKIFVHHELAFAIMETSHRVSNRSNYDDYTYKYVKAQEIAHLNAFDAVVVFSNEDKKKLDPLLQTKVFSVPFPIMDESFVKINTAHVLPIKQTIFLGGEKHFPNKEGIEWYITNMATAVYSKTKLPLHIIGDWSEETKQKYASNKGIVFAGFVENIAEYCRNSVMIVPIRIGSGIRTKILYAMAQGTPIISTTVGAEGISRENGSSPIVIADTPTAFVDAIEQMLANPVEVMSMIEDAQLLAREQYSQASVGQQRLDVVQTILKT